MIFFSLYTSENVFCQPDCASRSRPHRSHLPLRDRCCSITGLGFVFVHFVHLYFFHYINDLLSSCVRLCLPLAHRLTRSPAWRCLASTGLRVRSPARVGHHPERGSASGSRACQSLSNADAGACRPISFFVGCSILSTEQCSTFEAHRQTKKKNQLRKILAERLSFHLLRVVFFFFCLDPGAAAARGEGERQRGEQLLLVCVTRKEEEVSERRAICARLYRYGGGPTKCMHLFSENVLGNKLGNKLGTNRNIYFFYIFVSRVSFVSLPHFRILLLFRFSSPSLFSPSLLFLLLSSFSFVSSPRRATVCPRA